MQNIHIEKSLRDSVWIFKGFSKEDAHQIRATTTMHETLLVEKHHRITFEGLSKLIQLNILSIHKVLCKLSVISV